MGIERVILFRQHHGNFVHRFAAFRFQKPALKALSGLGGGRQHTIDTACIYLYSFFRALTAHSIQGYGDLGFFFCWLRCIRGSFTALRRDGFIHGFPLRIIFLLGIIGDTTAAYDAGEAYGDFFRAASIKRVTITSVNGAAFDENATYAVIGDNFLMNGNDTYYTFGAVKEAGENYVEVSTFGGLKTRDVVALYIQEVMNGTVGSDYANAQGRITVK